MTAKLTTYSNSKFTDNAVGSISIEIPKGKYLILFGGTTQSSEKIIKMKIGEGAPWSHEYIQIYTPINGTAQTYSASRAAIKTFSTSNTNTVTLSYEENWYWAGIMATKLA